VFTGEISFPAILVSFKLSFQTFPSCHPVSYVLNAVGVLMINGIFWDTMLSAYAVMALIVIVPLGATLYLFRRIVR
jgi:ABC-type multidrug transport system permease subunit